MCEKLYDGDGRIVGCLYDDGTADILWTHYKMVPIEYADDVKTAMCDVADSMQNALKMLEDS